MADQKIRHSSQAHIDIEDIGDNVVLLRSGAAALVLETSSTNFDLLSEKEQDAAIYAYAGLLNSLTFPMQIVIRSRRSDISSYIEKLKDAELKQNNPDLKGQIAKYRAFISEIVQKNQVLDKRFYLIIPFVPAELGLKGVQATLGKKKKQEFSREYLLEQAKINLYPKRDHILKQLARIGLRAQQLNTQQLIELFYDIYNPGQVSAQKVAPQIGSYTTVMVEPAVQGGEGAESSPPPPAPQKLETPPQALAQAASSAVSASGQAQATSSLQEKLGPQTSTPQPMAPPPIAAPVPPPPTTATMQSPDLPSNQSGPQTNDEKYQKMVFDLQNLVQKAKRGG